MEETKENPIDELFREAIVKFLRQIDGQRNAFPITMNALLTQSKISQKKIAKIARDNGFASAIEDESEHLQVPPQVHDEFISEIKSMVSTEFAVRNEPRNCVISMICSYDAFIGDLIRIIFQAKSDSIKAQNTEIPISELLEFSSIEEIKDYVIDKQIETVLRKNHEEQLDYLAKKIGLETLKKYDSFKDFVEIMERRNLFVHSDGKVSRQYIEQCLKAGCNVEVKVGEFLNADYAYVKKTYDVLAETGVKLSQIIWRKISTGVENSDTSLQDITYNYLRRGQYELANKLLAFALSPSIKHHDSEFEWVFRVNYALSYYLADDKEQSDKIVHGYDWAALEARYRLAAATLLEDYEKASAIMLSIGNNDEFRVAYQQWPLFRKFRRTEVFKKIYEEIFGQPFTYEENKRHAWKDFLTEAQSIMAEEEAK